ncbi:hypothetical protein HNQ59_003950 [Chitinivorax tropicus]|uniref:Uncharacterized protein n=1 Tax=Chitinivorax tropicus TaxID=714531 RepID=A0A840MT95_9PROT|nr:hypothetical protein [Chitinivorax tropicus]MBB5020625.1 hypothetical protein [Chitinivorax tropicus]
MAGGKLTRIEGHNPADLDTDAPYDPVQEAKDWSRTYGDSIGQPTGAAPVQILSGGASDPSGVQNIYTTIDRDGVPIHRIDVIASRLPSQEASRSFRDSVQHAYAAERAADHAFYESWKDQAVTNGGLLGGLQYVLADMGDRLNQFGHSTSSQLDAALLSPGDGLTGLRNGVVNFGPNLFNGAINTVKQVSSGYAQLAGLLPFVSQDMVDGYTRSEAWNLEPLLKNQNAAQAGGDLIGNLLLGGGLSRYGGMNVGKAASGAGRWMLNEFGPQAGLMFERYQYKTGLVQYAMPPEFKLGRVSGGVELGGGVVSRSTLLAPQQYGRIKATTFDQFVKNTEGWFTVENAISPKSKINPTFDARSGWEQYQGALNSRDIPVIGSWKTGDMRSFFDNTPHGYTYLHADPWQLQVNDSWMLGHLERGASFRVVSDIFDDNVLRTAPALRREVDLLTAHGYSFVPEELPFVNYSNLRASARFWKEQGMDVATRRVLIENSVPGPNLKKTNSGWFIPGER